MTAVEEQTTGTGGGAEPDYEVIIVGAGVAGIYQLYRMVQLLASSGGSPKMPGAAPAPHSSGPPQ